MIYSNFSFPKHFRQYLKIRNSQTLKTYLLCGCRPPLWWIEISIANTQFWSLPISLHIYIFIYIIHMVRKYQGQMSEFDRSKNTKIKWVGFIGQKSGQKRPISSELVSLVKKDQGQIQMSRFDWSKRPLTWSRWPHQVLAKRIQWESAENLVIINQPINLLFIHHLMVTFDQLSLIIFILYSQ